MATKGESRTTTDHEEIRAWVTQRDGKPARVIGTGGKDDAGLLRIDFPGFSGEGRLEHISWDDFFRTFDESNLAFVYQDKTADGEESRFNKLVDRSTVEEETKSRR
jgi:hypothetical protein